MKLFIATPCYGGLVARNFMLSMISLNNALVKRGLPFTFATVGNESLVTRARNGLAAGFLADAQSTHLLFIDADLSFPVETVLRLLEHGGPLVAAACPKKNIDWEAIRELAPHAESPAELAAAGVDLAVGVSPEGETFPGERFDRRIEGGFVRAAYVGTGMMLVARPVFETLAKELPDLRYMDLDAPEGQRERFAFFDTLIHPATGRYLSEDYAFCHRWRGCGGEVWIDAESAVGHLGSYLFESDTSVRVKLEARRLSSRGGSR